MSTVQIAHARGGDPTYTPGDQTGGEVRVQPWYQGGWTVLLRPKSPAAAEKMVSFALGACANDNVGYGQSDRNSLRAEAVKAEWKPERINTPCNCDCSSFASCCAEAAGIDVPYVNIGGGAKNAPVTWTIRDAFTLTGQFEVLTDAAYLTGPDRLRRGDVLVNEPQASGHAVVVTTDGSKAKQAAKAGGKTETPASTAKPDMAKDSSQAQTYKVQWGDTLWALSRRFGVSVETLAERNQIENPHIIYAGMTLEIPEAES